MELENEYLEAPPIPAKRPHPISSVLPMLLIDQRNYAKAALCIFVLPSPIIIHLSEQLGVKP